ncbi:hypothetical protein SAMN02927921_00250 [Sinomicrobium oceani]|uniref:Uncharacterized protein n=1 Tax=Sinomicrobium oceani TaxID=1150368 RepID=A0A1K1LU69_9FLAO|nr:hypothetical protein [Sinomicrobium oceani]SFW14457.1 hypothetical protein SAMN02927921_00250 [Sinomicrobium oceani]
MDHRFYTMSVSEQNRLQVVIAVSAFVFVIFTILIAVQSGIYLIGILSFAVTLSVVAPFFDTPALKKRGKLVYYSPLFIAEKPEKGIIKIHGGTWFDYYFVIDKEMNGKQRTRFILRNYLQGLLNLIEEFEDSGEMKVRGTSYIINERTAEKLGFRTVETDFVQKVILVYNYFNILISSSMAKRRISFPALRKIRTFEADIRHLAECKEVIRNLNDRLGKSVI